MASATLQVSNRFAIGATVGAYPQSGWATWQLPPSGAAVGSATTTGVVAADGSLLLTGLADGTKYFVGLSTGVGGYVNLVTPKPSADRAAARLAALGLIAESVPFLNSSGIAPTTQIAYGSGVYLFAGEVVTNIWVFNGSGTTGAPTLLKFGLWNSAAVPVCLAASADVKAAPTIGTNWTTTGFKAAALSAPYTVTVSDWYYAALLINGAYSGGFALTRIATNSGDTIRGLSKWPNPNLGAKTDMAALDTGSYAGGTAFWMAVS